ncbi:MAG: CDP-diacylglycerol--glycerol-3-phosphate 3-phosphatidyltransferase [Acidimicrobiia bacterium]|nr:CDP-diacylglycerol--glycerol-3-phosphate 3-phosphatidyltransferase [Acidimicrobiia bacterium]
MSIPNLLAVVRIILTPIAMVLIAWSVGDTPMTVTAAVVFAVAALTDFADGYLARRWKITTTLGAFLDTIADKILLTGALLALVYIGTTSMWAAFIMIGREIAVMGLRSVAALDKSEIVPPSIWGKSKAAVQFVAITVAILRPDIVIGPLRLDEWLMWVAVIVTLLSGWEYFSRFRSVLSPRRRVD